MATKTRGQRRIGKTIRKLENSVELSSKESTAKDAEKKYKTNTHASLGYTEDSPIQKLGDTSNKKENRKGS